MSPDPNEPRAHSRISNLRGTVRRYLARPRRGGAFARQRINNMVGYLAAPLGGNVNGRATDRLDRSYHHWWNCRLARRAVHEEPNGAGYEHRARHHWGRCRQLAVRLPRYLVWRLDWLSDCRLHPSLHPNRDRPRIPRRSSAANMKGPRAFINRRGSDRPQSLLGR